MQDPEESYMEKEGRKAKRGCTWVFLAWAGSIVALVLIGSSPKQEWQGWLIGVGYALIWFLCPAFGLLYALELKRFLGWQGKKSASAFWFRFLIWLGCWLLGVCITLLGIALLLSHWDTDEALGLKVFMAIIGGGLLWGAWFLFALPFRRYRGVTEAQEIAAFERWKHRMENPDFEGIEVASGAILPASYKAMILPDSEWQRDDWMIYPLGLENDEVLHMITDIQPADTESLCRKRNPVTGAEDLYLHFASEDYSRYLLKLEPGNDDPEVYEYWNEHGEFPVSDPPSTMELEKVCDHFSQFIAWPKEKF